MPASVEMDRVATDLDGFICNKGYQKTGVRMSNTGLLNSIPCIHAMFL